MKDLGIIYSITDNIHNVIKRFIKQEEATLKSLCNKSIFDMPELALVYGIGKEIYINRELVFGINKVEWIREATYAAQGGPSDLIFKMPLENNNSLFWTIEFKISGKKEDYLRDIAKLKTLQKDHEGLFCAIIDSWPKKFDERAELFRDRTLVDRIYRDTLKFSTTSSRYPGKEIEAVVGFGRVKRFELDSEHILPLIHENPTEEEVYIDQAQRDLLETYFDGENDDIDLETMTIKPDSVKNEPL